jgi:hypothetical protein
VVPRIVHEKAAACLVDAEYGLGFGRLSLR